MPMTCLSLPVRAFRSHPVPTPRVAPLDPEAMQQLQAVAPFVAGNNQNVTGESSLLLPQR